MKQVRRGLTLSTLNVFIHHYFSLSWLREYIMDKKVSKCIFYNPENDEEWKEISASYERNTRAARDSLQFDRRQMYFDLMFLIRIAHQRYPTAELLGEIMKHFDALERNYTLRKSKLGFDSPLNSIYFSTAISNKLSALNGDLATLWKQVAGIPLDHQLRNNHYQKAKYAELKTLGYSIEGEFKEWGLHDDTQGEITEGWLKMDIKLRAAAEKRLSRKDLIKYYKFLLLEDSNEGNVKLVTSWEDFIGNEEDDEGGYDEFLVLAWCHRRILPKRLDPILSPVSVLWQRTIALIEFELYTSEADEIRPAFRREGQLAFEFEKTLTAIDKAQKRFIQSMIPNDNQFVHDLKELVSDISKLFRAHFLELLSTVSPITSHDDDDDDDNAEFITQLDKKIRVIQKSWKAFELDWKTKLTSLIKAVQIRDELLLYYEHCPDLIQLVEKVFFRYYDEITTQFTKQKHAIQHQSDYQWVQFDKCTPLCYLDIFPFREELLYHSKKSTREKNSIRSDSLSSSTPSVHLHVIAVIVQIQLFIADCQQDFERMDNLNRGSRNTTEDEKNDYVKRKYIRDLDGELLDKINVSLALLQSADYSPLKTELILEYLKGCLELYKVEMSYRRLAWDESRLFRVRTTFSKVQECLVNNPVEDERIQMIEIKKFRKVLELLRKLPHVDREYFKDLMIWVVNELLAGKEVDLLLLELFQEQKYHRNDLFFAYFNLLKYYLPANYSALMDAALKVARVMETEQVSLKNCTDPESKVITKMNYQLNVYLRCLFESAFRGDVFIPEKEKLPPKDFLQFVYLLPVLAAFQRKRLGLLLEWKSWICYKGSYDRKVVPNLFQKKLQEAFQSEQNNNSNNLLASIINDDDDSFARLNVWMVCDNFLQGRMSKRSSDEPKIISTVREFVVKSMNLLNAEDNAEEVMRDCLPVVALYLEYVEIVVLTNNSQNKADEIEELENKMIKLIR
jgi:hypothetical protein